MTSPLRSLCPLLLVPFVLFGCDTHSQDVDPKDLQGVFDKASGSAERPNKKPPPKSSASAVPRPPPRVRTPVTGPCVEERGEPAKLSRRAAGRPACRRSRVLEWRDDNGTPRYGCVFAARGYKERTPLPLVLFFHDTGERPTAVHRKTRLRARYHKLDLVGGGEHRGFVILAPQARKLLRPEKKGPGQVYFDTSFTKRSNPDVVATDHFVDELIALGEIDATRIYAIGHGRGGTMAALYALLRPDRVAAFGVFGADPSELVWNCAGSGPPAAVLYRACDSVTRCRDVETWLERRREAGAATMSLRLGVGKATETNCAVSRCSDKRGSVNHARWPKPREGEMLEYLATFELRSQ